MGLCINPYCDRFCQPSVESQTDHCLSCGATFLLNGRYRLLKLLKPLAQSSEIKIYEAKDIWTPEQNVILKLLDYPHPGSRNQLKREYEFLLQMSPPFLQIELDYYFETPIHPDLPIVIYGLALPKLDGIDSHQFIRDHGAISIEQAMQWFQQLLNFVTLMHEQGYLHRDIKPSNVIVQSDLSITLIDFGTVRKMDKNYLSIIGGHLVTETGQSQTLTRIISPGFSAPEQIEGLAVPQSDFFSMARTFAFWITGESPHTFPISPTGVLTWPKRSLGIDRSLKQYLNDMMSLAVEQRPAKASFIQHYLEVDWPTSQRLHRLFSSPWFRGLATASFLGLAAISYFLLSFILSRFFFYRGSERIFAGKYEAAKANLSLSLKMDSGFEDAHHNFALLCQTLQDYDCALHHHHQALKLNGTRWESHYNLGGLWEDLEQFDSAKAAYLKAIELSQSTVVAPLNNLARLEILRGQPEAAIAYLQQAQALSPAPENLAVIQKNLGWARLEQNQPGEALQALQKSQTLNPNLADTYCLMAQLYDSQAQSTQSNSHWVTCLSLQSDSRDVLKWREEFLRRAFQEDSHTP